MPPSRGSAKNISHCCRFTLSGARRRNASPVQGGGDLAKRLRSGSLSFAYRWHDDVGVRVGLGLKGGVGDGAGISQPGVAESCPRAFCGGEGGLRALGDHRALLLGQGGV